MEEKKENKIWFFIKKHIKPKTILYLVIVLAVAGLAFGVGKEFNTESKTTKLGFEDIGELATQVAYCSEVNVTDESRDIYGIKILVVTDKISQQQYLFLVSPISCAIIFLRLVTTNLDVKNGCCQICFLKKGRLCQRKRKNFWRSLT